MAAVIDVRGAHKRYGETVAMDDVSFTVQAVELYSSFYAEPADADELLAGLGLAEKRHQVREAVRRSAAAAIGGACPGRQSAGRRA